MSKTWTNRHLKHEAYNNKNLDFMDGQNFKEWRQCRMKSTFGHYKEAMAAAAKVPSAVKLNAYRCPQCKKYHLTRRPAMNHY